MKTQYITIQMTMLAVAALLIAAGCSKHQPPTESKTAKPPTLVEANVGVDKVQKGMNTDQVEAAIGKPEKINGNAWIYLKRGIYVSFAGNGIMFNIKCVSPFAGVTKEGIGIGSTRADLLAAYGNPSEEKHYQGFDDLWFAPLGINFDLVNDKVTSFIVHLDVR